MESYFTAIQPHLEDHVDITVINQNQSSSSSRALLSLGIDSVIFVKDLSPSSILDDNSQDTQNRVYLPQGVTYSCIAKGMSPGKCLLGSEQGTVDEFTLQNKQTRLLYKSQPLYKINSLTNSPTNRYLAIASQQSKCTLLDLQSLKTSKCRPGHQSGVVNVTFSHDQKYLASIGADNTLLIFNISNFDQPLQMFRFKICKTLSIDSKLLAGCFNKVLQIYYAPGMKQLQIIQLLNSKWQHRISTFIKHNNNTVIQLVKTLKQYLLLTATQNQLIIWNNRNDEKLIVIEEFTLNKIIQIGESFWGCRHNGYVYYYKKILNEAIGGQGNTKLNEQRMELQNQTIKEKNKNDVISFNDDSEDEEGQEEGEEQQSLKNDLSEQERLYELQKKSKADKIVKTYPQKPIVNETLLYEDAKYIHTSHKGYLIENRENQLQIKIVFQSEEEVKNQLLFTNKEVKYADFGQNFVAYAGENAFGVKFLKNLSELQSWEKNWWSIISIVCSHSWVAVANNQQIKIFDLAGNQFKSISFDRQLIALAAYENLLAVVYHESIPIEQSQCLTMQLYIINSYPHSQPLQATSCHVPIKPKSQLKYFRFTEEGMLISQDASGFIKIYNLESNSWTSVFIEGIEDARRIWILGMTNYQIVYWKTTELNPNPQVFPRLPVKTSKLGTNVAVEASQEMESYPFLMFQRFCLDHQKCRFRLWGQLKNSRKQTHPGYSTTSTILTNKELLQHHNQLDYKFYNVIKYYLQSKMPQKALMSIKTLIRTFEAGKKLSDLFDDFGKRQLAADLERYYEEKEREIQYETIQALELQSLKQQAQKSIKPKGQNNPFNRKKNVDTSSIPSLNNSQMSQSSNFDGLSQRSTFKATTKQNGIDNANKKKSMVLETPQKQQMMNPFIKKKSSQDDININMKSKQIQEQIQKYGIKKKAQIGKKNNPTKIG